MMSGGAVQMACSAVREVILERAALELHLAPADMVLEEGELVTKDGEPQRVARRRTAKPGRSRRTGSSIIRRPNRWTRTARATRTGRSPSPRTGRSSTSTSELGLVKVVQVATAQDIGKALNPLAVTGQIEGGIAQGVGLAVMEEIVVDGSRIRNPSFTDYLLPTPLDMPPVVQTWIEQPERGAPYGAKGVGEPPTISSTGAVARGDPGRRRGCR